MNEKPKTKWYWRLLRRGLIGLAVILTLAAILITEEDWRGKRDWENYKQAAEARGERFDVATLVPPVADDQNFFCAPMVAEALKSESRGTNGVNRMVFNIYPGEMMNWITNGG